MEQSEIDEIMDRQKQLAKQSFATLEGEIGPLTFEIMSRQATINIGTIGHVSHGKTTVVKGITGVNTIRASIEKERNITYNLGYANAKLYKCPKCPAPSCFKSYGSSKEDSPPCDNENCGEKLELQRHISFVDCPGHDILMATMLNGAAVMDAALLLVAANQPCPQPQTSEHLAAVEIMNLEKIIILQNKIDIVASDENAIEQYRQIKAFVNGSKAQNSPIIPISAQMKYNLDVVVEYLCNLPVPIRDLTSPPKFIVVRSFDINKPGTTPEELKGGVAGGTLTRGILRLKDKIEIRPGIYQQNANKEIVCKPLFATIESIYSEKNEMLYTIPGGLIAFGLNLDPSLCMQNNLLGRVCF